MHDESEQRHRGIREATASVIGRLAEIGWVERSYVDDKNLLVKFTPIGKQFLVFLSLMLPKEAWPKTQNEIIALMLLCDEANDQG
jgi:hypothetical protein